MDLVGAWLRQLLQAGTAAAIVPVAMVAALVVVLVGAGGFGGLGALGQLVAGPQIAPAERQARVGPRSSGARDVAPVAPAVASESPGVRRPATSPPPAPVAPSTPPPPPEPANPPPPPPPPPPRPLRPPPPPPQPPQPQPQPSPAAQSRPPTAKERRANFRAELKETVDEVGTAVGEVVEGLGDTVAELLGPPPPPPR